MAKKKVESETPSEPVKPSEVEPMISGGRLKRLLTLGRAAVRDAAQIASAFGSEVKAAKKSHHLHLGVFKTIQKLDRMEPEELRTWMDHFEYQYDASGLKKRADSVMRMPLADNEDEEEDDTSKVSTFPAAAGNA